nr:ammonium transporter 3 member 1-like [Tanacetum cinerariifolium]
MALDGSDRDAKYALSKLLQMGTVAEYQSEFEILINRVNDETKGFSIAENIEKNNVFNATSSDQPAAGSKANKVVNDDDDEVKVLNWVQQAIDVESLPSAYQISASSPDWLNKGDNAWQMISATLVGLQSVPGLVILYGSIVKKKWAVNSAFMALYAFSAVVICWVTWGYKMSFGEELLPFWGKAGPALGQKFLIKQAALPASTHYHHDGSEETPMLTPLYPMASMVWFQCVFAAIALILLAGSLLGRMNIKAWMAFVPLWLTFSYTVGAFSLWGGGFLFHWGVMDYSGGYVIHLSSGVAVTLRALGAHVIGQVMAL